MILLGSQLLSFPIAQPLERTYNSAWLMFTANAHIASSPLFIRLPPPAAI